MYLVNAKIFNFRCASFANYFSFELPLHGKDGPERKHTGDSFHRVAAGFFRVFPPRSMCLIWRLASWT
jgi:hypothetical protein